MLDFLQAAVSCRLNMIVSGGTGAGKTTMLNMLSGFIPERERIVTIEDAAELKLQQRHVVRLETRPPNIEGKGAIKQRQLVINALRMRPDRIIVGEVRGEEALDMLQAMNTGHDGSLTTIHANSPRDALYRLDTMVAMANLQYSRAGRAAADRVGHQPRRPGHAHGGRHAQGHGDHRNHRHGAGRHHDAGHLRVREAGVDRGRQGQGPFRATGIRPKCAQTASPPQASTFRGRCSNTCRWWHRTDYVDSLPFTFTLAFGVVWASTGWSSGRKPSRAGVRAGCASRAEPKTSGDTTSLRQQAPEQYPDAPVGVRAGRSGVGPCSDAARFCGHDHDRRPLHVASFLLGAIAYTVIWFTLRQPGFGLVAAGCRVPAVPGVRRKRSNRLLRFEEQFPDAIDLVARAMRAGHGLNAGLGMVADEIGAPVGREFRLIYDSQNYGMSLPEALHRFAERMPLLDARFFVTSVLTQRESGGNFRKSSTT